MIRSFMIALAVASAAQSASAATFLFRGQIASREACRDQGFFSSSQCRKVALGQNRDCTVSLATDSRGNLTALQVSSRAWVEAGDHRREGLSGRLTKPYLRQSDFVAYNSKIDRDTSVEVKISGTRVLGAYVFTNHVQGKNGTGENVRAFNQYFCTNLSPAKQAR